MKKAIREMFSDLNGKISYGRIISAFSFFLGIVLFVVTIAYNWYSKTTQDELFILVKWMFVQGGSLYTVSKALDKTKNNQQINSPEEE